VQNYDYFLEDNKLKLGLFLRGWWLAIDTLPKMIIRVLLES